METNQTEELISRKAALPVKEYRFSLGDSTNQAVGVCLSVYATSAEEAVDILRQQLDESYEYLDPESFGDKPISNPVVYFNPEKITAEHIEEVFDPSDE
jgi:hypothetical protein